MSRWAETTDEFDAISEDGQTFRIVVSMTMIDNTSSGNPNAKPLEGRLKRYCTSDGQDCERIDDDTFEVVGLGLRVRRTR